MADGVLEVEHAVCFSADEQKAPRVDQFKNQSLFTVGAWKINRLRRQPHLEFYPWKSPESIPVAPPTSKRVNRDPLALAHFYQSLLDSHVVATRAQLARYLGVSRARVTQVLRRLARTSRTQEGAGE